ncbi:copper resistance protein NlpE N-terminal domain-containing protein [Psychrobacter sp. ANT_WB68]|uniref:copper resistance protein NlpE N-terminal domain-containing protein n=1 Tax=Psychrobacter sp. ANT_WB68 TaxID=2597355 RepID=UPI0011F1DBA1|nr:copper resistance protein NlpE N-terminal domain-containing protein [Psychrobacter sp. ANT_WB68]KAA0913438.1 copper resistance protein NlpE [Psychrobacter sp. ANT_WB68]
MITFSPISSSAIMTISRSVRPLLALPVCLLLMSCDSASSSTNKTTQGTPINSLQQTDLQNDQFQESNANDVVNEASHEEGQPVIAATNLADSTRRVPMISGSNNDSMLQATLMGDYGGIVPCDSCDNITITLNLFSDGSVLKTSLFNHAEPARAPLLESGVYRQDDDMITIVYERQNIETYHIKDNLLIMMDADKNPDDDYTLSRK